MGHGKRAFWQAIGQPALRTSIVIVFAVGWFLMAGVLFLQYLPSFNGYNVLIASAGLTDNDVYYFWAWTPTIFLLLLGIFWSSGLLGKFGKLVGF